MYLTTSTPGFCFLFCMNVNAGFPFTRRQGVSAVQLSKGVAERSGCVVVRGWLSSTEGCIGVAFSEQAGNVGNFLLRNIM